MNTNILDESYLEIQVGSDEEKMGNLVALENVGSSPLSPILGGSLNQRKIIRGRRTRSRVNLESKFLEPPKPHEHKHNSKANTDDRQRLVSTKVSKSVDKLKKIDELEKQHRKKYDLLCTSDADKLAKSNSNRSPKNNNKLDEGKNNKHKSNQVSKNCKHDVMTKVNNNLSKPKSAKQENEPTVINIKIKGFKSTKEKNEREPMQDSNVNKESNKNFEVILLPNEAKTCHKNLQENVHENPVKLFQEYSSKEVAVTDSQLASTAARLSQNMKPGAKSSNLENYLDSPNNFINSNSNSSECANDLIMSTQETNLYFANFTQKINEQTGILPNPAVIENDIDRLLVPHSDKKKDFSFTKYEPILDSETSDCFTIPEERNGFLGCAEKENLEVSRSSKILNRLFMKLEEDIGYEYLRKQNSKKCNSPSAVVPILKPNTALCKKSKSMDVISEYSSETGKNKERKELACYQPKRDCVAKSIQIEIKNNNHININIDSNHGNKKDSPVPIGAKIYHEGSMRTKDKALKDKFHAHQQKLSRVVKSAMDNVKFTSNCNQDTKRDEDSTVLTQLRSNGRKKQLLEADDAAASAPATKRNKCDDRQLSPSTSLKQMQMQKQKQKQKQKERESPRKGNNTPVINVFNVTTTSGKLLLKNSEPRRGLAKKANNSTLLFNTGRGRTIDISVSTLHETERKYVSKSNNSFLFNTSNSLLPIERADKSEPAPRTLKTDEMLPETSLSATGHKTSIQMSESTLQKVPSKHDDITIASNPAFSTSSFYKTGRGRVMNVAESVLRDAENNYGNMNKPSLPTRIAPNKLFAPETSVSNQPSLEANTIIYNMTDPTLNPFNDDSPEPRSIDAICTELQRKDIRSILLNTEGSAKNVTESEPKRDCEMIEDAIKIMNNALEKIERKEAQSCKTPESSAPKRKGLGMRRGRAIQIDEEQCNLAKAKLMDSSPFCNTPKVAKPRFESLLQTSTPLRGANSGIDNHFAGDFITPIKGRSSKFMPVEDHDANDRLIINSSREDNVGYADEINRLIRRIKVLEERKAAAEIQEHLIKHADEEHRRHRNGFLMGLKTNRKRIALKDVEPLICQKDFLGTVARIDPQNALKIQFNLKADSNEDSVVRTVDGAIVIPDIGDLAGFEAIERAFLAMPGVKCEAIPTKWIRNHFRWIVWKLASYERKFDYGFVLSIENVVQQLKYRYDKELCGVHRPTLRKIFERDDISEKRMVLCVADIIPLPANEFELELTDGWYSIRTCLDKPLTTQVANKNVIVGTKITIQCARLVSNDPCEPLDDLASNVRLRINYNNTRRAQWHSKLGYQQCCYWHPISLRTVHQQGGLVGCLKLYIARVYPLKYLEKQQNNKVWRNDLAENKRAQRHEMELEKDMEELEFEFRQRTSRETSQLLAAGVRERDIHKVECPETLNALLEQSNDPEGLMSMLSHEQSQLLRNYREQRHISLSVDLGKEAVKLRHSKDRKVVRVLKLLVYDADGSGEKGRYVFLWKFAESEVDCLKEEETVLAYSLIPDFNNTLKSTPTTRFKRLTTYPKLALRRKLLPINILTNENYAPAGEEFDTIGVFVGSYHEVAHQEIWLSDFVGRLLCVRVYSGKEECSLLNVNIIPGSIVLVFNLGHLKPNSAFALAVGSLQTVVTTTCKVSYLLESVGAFKNQLPENLAPLIENCETKIEMLRKNLNVKSEKRVDNNASIFLQNRSNSHLLSHITEDEFLMSLIDVDSLN